MSLKLAQHGDKACKASEGLVTLTTAGVNTFAHKLNEADMASALGSSFDFTVKIEADSVSDAKVVFSDPRAVNDATTVISPAYTLPTTLDCDIVVQDFCLTSMTETAEAGRWAFTFNLDVTSNDACGQLTANMDIM